MKLTTNIFLVRTDSKFISTFDRNKNDEYYILPENSEDELAIISEYYNRHKPKHLITDLFAGEYLHNPMKLIEYYQRLNENIKNLSLITIDDVRMLDYHENYSRLSIVSNTSKSLSDIKQDALIGLDFTIFNKKILETTRYIDKPKKYKFFISFGGSDVTFDTYKVIQSLYSYSHTSSTDKVKVVIGENLPEDYAEKVRSFCLVAGYEFTNFYSDYHRDLARSEFVICGEGSTKLDSIALGVPPIVISQFDHDSEPMKEFISSGLSYYFGKATEFCPLGFSQFVDYIINDTAGYAIKKNKGLQTYDCMGGFRVSRYIENL